MVILVGKLRYRRLAVICDNFAILGHQITGYAYRMLIACCRYLRRWVRG